MGKKSINNFKHLLLELGRLFVYIIKLFIKRFFKPKFIFLIIFIWLFYIRWSQFIGFLSQFGILEFTLIKDYLALFLSIPVAATLIVITFFKIFKKEIKIFLKNSKLKQVGPYGFASKKEISQASVEASKPAENISSPSPSPAFEDEPITQIDPERAEFFILDTQSLVFNSKIALAWFYNNSNATKSFFIDTFLLSGSFENQNIEKENIFSVLYANELLELSGEGKFKVSIKGQRFLKYIKLIPE